jgi:transposase-like protein
MGVSRRQYTDEFKREAVQLVASSGRPVLAMTFE